MFFSFSTFFDRICINGVAADDMYNEGKVSSAKNRIVELEKLIETAYASIKYREVEISKIAGKEIILMELSSFNFILHFFVYFTTH